MFNQKNGRIIVLNQVQVYNSSYFYQIFLNLKIESTKCNIIVEKWFFGSPE